MQISAIVREVGSTEYESKGQPVTVGTVSLEYAAPMAIDVIQMSPQQTHAGLSNVYRALVGKRVLVPLELRTFTGGARGSFSRWSLTGDGKPVALSEGRVSAA